MSRRGITAFFTMVMAAGVMASGPVHQADATLPETTAAATFPGSNGRIAYTKAWEVSGTPGPDERSAVFTVRPDGTGNKRLTFAREAGKPIWSPSGGRIAYEQAGAVWVMKSDGSAKKRLIDGRLVGWMPTGGRILAVRDLGGYATDPTWLLYTLSTGETEELPIDLPLVAGIEEPYHDFSEWTYAAQPTLSPDGELLALTLWRYDSGDDGYGYYHGSIFTVRLDGTELTRIPGYDYSWGSPSWSPDGDELVYWGSEPRAGCIDSVRSIYLDGTRGSVGISKPCGEYDPDWSPNGNKIVFTASERLQIANLTGTRITTVLHRTVGVYLYDPDWRSVR
ncbi:hypothetical protein D0Z08_30865 [Nocardioides immobilis]|uniref:Uncharacterized protein n=1 Tax=Nocardioides immobilis TaxID=2049295 RepID=A0A417XS00_9ACTN|nr:PD40 domain-containing protein [Nocardioides immobilis]RHW23232.1 hypothetical protein D0Z08_30865 [Nocardioides immobilis]